MLPMWGLVTARRYHDDMDANRVCPLCGESFTYPADALPPALCQACHDKAHTPIVTNTGPEVTAAYNRWQAFKRAFEGARERGHRQQALGYLYAERRAMFQWLSVRDGVAPPLESDIAPHVQGVIDFYGEDWPE